VSLPVSRDQDEYYLDWTEFRLCDDKMASIRSAYHVAQKSLVLVVLVDGKQYCDVACRLSGRETAHFGMRFGSAYVGIIFDYTETDAEGSPIAAAN